MRIIRLTKDEFELSDGRVFPILPPLDQDMTVEEFQKHYDYAVKAVAGCGTVGRNDSNVTDVGRAGED